MWLQPASPKSGHENSSFLHHNGAGVAGFAAHGVAAYSWWGASCTVSSSERGWIGVLIAFAEFAIGVCLAIGFLTPLAALGSLALLFTYVMSEQRASAPFTPVRDRDSHDVEDFRLDWRRRTSLWSTPASRHKSRRASRHHRDVVREKTTAPVKCSERRKAEKFPSRAVSGDSNVHKFSEHASTRNRETRDVDERCHCFNARCSDLQYF